MVTGSSATTDRPVFGELERGEALALLARNHIGRIAFAFHDHVDVQPVHYVYHDAWIYLRTSPGSKTETLSHNYWVAFQVDEIDGDFDWQSVVVRGGAYRLEPGAGGGPTPFDRAVELLRTVVPETLTDADPAPHRTELYRIAVQNVTGRYARAG